MRIVSISTLKAFYEQPRHRAAESVIRTWIVATKAAAWTTPIDVKATFGQTDILPNGRAVFDLSGNKYRIVAWINYRKQIVFIKFVDTHKEYDSIDATTVG